MDLSRIYSFLSTYTSVAGNNNTAGLGGLRWALTRQPYHLINRVNQVDFNYFIQPYISTTGSENSCNCDLTLSNEASEGTANTIISRNFCIPNRYIDALINRDPDTTNSFRSLLDASIDAIRRDTNKAIIDALYGNIGDNNANSPISNLQISYQIFDNNEAQIGALINLHQDTITNNVESASLIAFQPTAAAMQVANIVQYQNIRYYVDNYIPYANIMAPNPNQALLIDNRKAFVVFGSTPSQNEWQIRDDSESLRGLGFNINARLVSESCSSNNVVNVQLYTQFGIVFESNTGNTGVYDYELTS